jgi:peptidoglycan hydrolase CwlO-like protein
MILRTFYPKKAQNAKVNKYLFIAAILLLNIVNIAAAQETVPDKPPSDEGVRQQTEPQTAQPAPALRGRLERARANKNLINQKAIDTGRNSDKRFQRIMAKVESLEEEIEIKLQEMAEMDSPAADTETEISSGLTELEGLIQQLEHDVTTAEPGNPPSGRLKK